MAAHVVRTSKFRHVYCDNPRPDATFSNIRLSTVTGEQNYIKANSKYFAVGLDGGGGPLSIFPLDKPGRFTTGLPHFSGHTGPVLDFDFYPFSDNIIASASDDTTIKLWEIPEGGLTSVITTPLISLSGHHKKVTSVNFHPTAANVLASTSADNTVKIWDVERGGELNTLEHVHDQLIQDFAWDFRGNNYATSSKDKNVRIVDARSATVTATIESAHEGSKSTKLVFLGASDKLATIGFSRTSARQLKIWDPRNTSQELIRHDMDQAAGVIMPFFDSDTNLLFLAGKGDGNVRCFEITPEGDQVFPVSEFRSSVSAKGMAMVPKRGLNVRGNEVARLLKLTTNSVEPLSFVVPRKADGFQEDIYPDTFSGVPSHTAEEWFGGSDQPPMTMSLNPGALSPTPATPKSMSNRTFSFKSSAALQAELDKANERIHVLEARLAAAGLATD